MVGIKPEFLSGLSKNATFRVGLAISLIMGMVAFAVITRHDDARAARDAATCDMLPGHNISAPTPELISGVKSIIDDMQRISQYTRGCAADMAAHNTRIVVVPDTIANDICHAANGIIYIRADAVGQYTKMFTNSVIPRMYSADYNSVQTLHAILRAARHVQQHRTAISQIHDNAYQNKDMMAYVAMHMRMLADATQYADFCLYGVRMPGGPLSTKFKSTDFGTLDYNQFENFHTVRQLRNLARTGIPDLITHFEPAAASGDIMNKFEDAFANLTIPYAVDKLEYTKTPTQYAKTFRAENVKFMRGHTGFDIDSYMYVYPYINLLGIGEVVNWFNPYNAANMKYAVEKLNRLRENPDAARQYIYGELRNQMPTYDASNTHNKSR